MPNEFLGPELVDEIELASIDEATYDRNLRIAVGRQCGHWRSASTSWARAVAHYGRAEILVILNLRDFAAAKGMFDVVILSAADALKWLRKRP
jgi:hypothetical protein